MLTRKIINLLSQPCCNTICGKIRFIRAELEEIGPLTDLETVLKTSGLNYFLTLSRFSSKHEASEFCLNEAQKQQPELFKKKEVNIGLDQTNGEWWFIQRKKCNELW